MKFTKENAIEELTSKLKRKVGDPSISARTITNQVERAYAKLERAEDDETELSAFVEDLFPDIEDMEGNLRKLNSDFVKEYESKRSEKKDDVKEPQPKKVEDDNPVLARIQALEDELANARRNNAIQSKKVELIEKMQSIGVKDKEWANELIANISISEDLDVEEKANALLKLYNKSNAEYNPSLTPKGGENAPNMSSTLERVKALREAKIAEEKGKI